MKKKEEKTVNKQNAKKFIIAKNKYGSYCIPDGTEYRWGPRRLLAGEVHEPLTLRAIIKYARQRTVIHAGAFFGDALPALYQAGLRVIAFEPCQENWLHALGTLALNNISSSLGNQIELHMLALGEDNYEAEVVTYDSEKKVKLGGGCFVAPVGDQKCSVVSLDKFLKKRFEDIFDIGLDVPLGAVGPHMQVIGVIHLDIEGSEFPALSGAVETIKRCKPVIIVEGEKNVWPFLKKLGYRRLSEGTEFNTIFLPKTSNVDS